MRGRDRAGGKEGRKDATARSAPSSSIQPSSIQRGDGNFGQQPGGFFGDNDCIVSQPWDFTVAGRAGRRTEGRASLVM